MKEYLKKKCTIDVCLSCAVSVMLVTGASIYIYCLFNGCT